MPNLWRLDDKPRQDVAPQEVHHGFQLANRDQRLEKYAARIREGISFRRVEGI